MNDLSSDMLDLFLSSDYFLLILARSPLRNFPARGDAYNLKQLSEHILRLFILENHIHPK